MRTLFTKLINYFLLIVNTQLRPKKKKKKKPSQPATRQRRGERGKNKPSSSSSLFDDENLGTSTSFTELLLLQSDDLFHTKTKSPIVTANDVVTISMTESDIDSLSEIPSTDSIVRTNSEFEPIFKLSFLFFFFDIQF